MLMTPAATLESVWDRPPPLHHNLIDLVLYLFYYCHLWLIMHFLHNIIILTYHQWGHLFQCFFLWRVIVSSVLFTGVVCTWSNVSCVEVEGRMDVFDHQVHVNHVLPVRSLRKERQGD